MAGELAGKVAIIAGGSTGIGAATAKLFIEEGARVVIAARDPENGEPLAAKLGLNARFKTTDVGKRDDIQALVDYTLNEFGGLDVMFNNAAITGNFHNRFLNDDLSDLEEVLRVNLAGVMHGSQIAARHMVKQGSGSIINTTSIAALIPGYALFAYRAAKAGVINFSQALAIDLGEYCVRVNALAPGHIPTKLTAFAIDGLTEDQSAQYKRTHDEIYMADQPLKRRGTPRDAANVALFFASDRSVYVTGQVLSVDGGVTAGSAFNQNAMLTEARTQFLESLKDG